MKKILLAAGSDNSLQALEKTLDSLFQNGNPIFPGDPDDAQPEYLCLTEGSKIRNAVREDTFDLLILNTPLKDEQGVQLVGYAADSFDLPVIVMTGASTYDRSRDFLKGKGILVLQRPVTPDHFFISVQAVLTTGERLRIVREEKTALSKKVEEIRLVDRAKAVLMNNLKMSEAQAHRYIEKQAMDLRVSRREIAQNLLKIYYRK